VGRDLAKKAEVIVGRDALFRAFLNRDPTKEELQRLDRLGQLMGIHDDDSLWYNVIIGEIYEDRLAKRLTDIDNVASGAADKALVRIAEAVVEKADELAAQKDKGFTWRSLALLMVPVILVCAVTFNAGYVMGNGHYPNWVRSQNTFQLTLGWFLSVPSGWIALLGCSPIVFEFYSKYTKKIMDNKRFGRPAGKENLVLYAKSIACLVVLALTAVIMLYLTGANFMFQRFTFFLD